VLDRQNNQASVAERFDFARRSVPQLLWKARTGKFYGRPDIRFSDRNVYVNGIVIDSTTGALQADTVPPSLGSRAPELVWAGITYQLQNGRAAPTIQARDSTDGTARWSVKLRPTIFRDPTLILSDGVVFVAGSGHAGFSSQQFTRGSNGYVLALDARSGDILWMFVTDGEVQYPPVLVGSRILVGVGDYDNRHLYCLSTEPSSRLGQCLWHRDLAGLAQHGVAANGIVYWGSCRAFSGDLCAFDVDTGGLRWSFQTLAAVAAQGPPCVVDDWIFFGCEDGYLYGLDVQSGALRWKYFVVDEDALKFQRDENAELKSTHDHEFDGWSDDERREWEEYDRELDGKKKRSSETNGEANRAIEESDSLVPDHLDLFPWVRDSRLYVLTTQGFLRCFQLHLRGVPEGVVP
jgi:outer membrane protein assembly factor BamB